MDQLPARLVTARPGERWVIRRQLPDGSATDLVGWLEAVEPNGVRLEIGDGTVTVPASEVIVARRAPAALGGPDPARVSAAELEHITVPGWLAISEPLGEWTLRAGGGFTGRANSCHAVGDPGLPVAEAAARVVAFARSHGIAPWAQVVVGSAEDRSLYELGWRPAYVTTDVLVVRLADLLGSTVPPAEVVVSETLTDAWLEAFGRSRPNDADPGLVRMILDGHPPRAFAAATGSESRSDAMIGIARGHLHQSWLGIASVWTDPARRRQGWSRLVALALGHWAARRRARYAYLQVDAANRVAVEAYQRLGFRYHHSYRVLAAP